MSTARPTTRSQSEKPPDDPFHLGRRLVNRGTYYEEIPLTLDDVLHPEEDDRVTVNDFHGHVCTYLKSVLKRQLAKVPGACVLYDIRIAWDDPQLRPHGPDLAIVFGVRQHQHWSTFDVADEGTRPTLIIEVTSPATRELDLGIKKAEYEQARVEYYAIVDIVPTRGLEIPRLLGFQLTPRGYRPLPLDARGGLWLEPVDLRLRVVEGEIVCEDHEGTVFLDDVELDDERKREKARADLLAAEKAAADARIRELEAELRRRDEQQ